jgi:hypothetical protein
MISMPIKIIVILGLIAIIGILRYFVHHLDRYGEKNKFEALIWVICNNARMFFILLFPCMFGLLFVIDLSELLKFLIEHIKIAKFISVILLGVVQMLCIALADGSKGSFPTIGIVLFVALFAVALMLIDKYGTS